MRRLAAPWKSLNDTFRTVSRNITSFNYREQHLFCGRLPLLMPMRYLSVFMLATDENEQQILNIETCAELLIPVPLIHCATFLREVESTLLAVSTTPEDSRFLNVSTCKQRKLKLKKLKESKRQSK